jgi:hypothetical protein
MVTLFIWWGGIVIELMLLARGAKVKLTSRFPVFYAYILTVLLESLITYGFYHYAQSQYALAYWVCLFFAFLVGSLVVFEIYRVALHTYPGTSRMARNALLFVFALAIAKALVYQSEGTLSWLARTPPELERNLRIVQLFAILAIVCVLILYRIPCSRNLKGILTGYGLFVGSSVFQLSLLSYFGESFKATWQYLQPFSYLVFLAIWMNTMWSPAPEPLPRAVVAGDDYSQVASGTQEELAKLRFDLRKAAR